MELGSSSSRRETERLGHLCEVKVVDAGACLIVQVATAGERHGRQSHPRAQAEHAGCFQVGVRRGALSAGSFLQGAGPLSIVPLELADHAYHFNQDRKNWYCPV